MRTFSAYLEHRDQELYSSLLGETILLDEGVADMIKDVFQKVMGKRQTPDEMLSNLRTNTDFMNGLKETIELNKGQIASTPQDSDDFKKYTDKLQEREKLYNMTKQKNIALLEKLMQMTKNNPEWREKNGFKDKNDIANKSGMSLMELINLTKKAVVAGAGAAFLFALLTGGAGHLGNKHDGDMAPKMPTKSQKIGDEPDPDSWKNPGTPYPDIPSADPADQDSGVDHDNLGNKASKFRTPMRTILKGPGNYKTPIRDKLFGNR